MFHVTRREPVAARRRVPVYLVDATDGYTPETGVTSPTIEVSKNGATQASGAGAFAEIGDGVYYYEFAAAEVNTLGWVHLRVAKSGTSREYNAIVRINAFDVCDPSHVLGGATLADALVSGEVTDPANPPAWFNIERQAELIRYGDTRICWIGDSTASLANTPRWRQGIIKTWDVKWRGVYVNPVGTVEDEGGRVLLSTPTEIDTDGTASDGSSNETAFKMGEIAFASNIPNLNAIVLAQASVFSSYLNGAWSSNQAVKAAVFYRKPTVKSGLSSTAIVTVRNNGGGNVDSTFDWTTATEGTSSLEFDLIAPTGAASDDFQWGMSAGNTGENETGKTWPCNGVLFYTANVRGCIFFSIYGGGWSTTTHIAKWTQAQFAKASSLALHFNVIMISLGINRGTSEGETSGGKVAYKANLMTIIARARAAIDANIVADPTAPKPLFVLVNEWPVASSATERDWTIARAQVHYEICRENPDVGMIDLGGILLRKHGEYSRWQATYLSDGIHQSVAGTVEFASILWQAIVEASSPAALARLAMRQSLKFDIDEMRTTATSRQGSVSEELAAVAGYIDTEVGAIKTKTDLIVAFPSNFSAMVISAGGEVTASNVSGASDWTSAEKAQIRQALGVTGSQTDAAGGDLQGIATAVAALPFSVVGTATNALAPIHGPLKFAVNEARSETFVAASFDSTGWTEFVFAVKADPRSELDNSALLIVRVTNPGHASDGLLRVNGQAAEDNADASLTVTLNGTTTTVVLALQQAAMNFPPSPPNAPYHWELIRWIGDTKKRMAYGQFHAEPSVFASLTPP